MSQFYLYRHIRLDLNHPFYIGIGTKRTSKEGTTIKSEYHRAYAIGKTERKAYWHSIFQKCNKQIEVEILFESDSYDEIKEKEKEFIALYGRKGVGPLCNHTDGGEGITGTKMSPEAKQKMRAAKLGRKLSPESIKKRTESRKGYRHSKETIEKIKLSNLGKPATRKGCRNSEESKEKARRSNKGKWLTPEQEVKYREAMKKVKPNRYWLGKKRYPETIKKINATKLAKKNAA